MQTHNLSAWPLGTSECSSLLQESLMSKHGVALSKRAAKQSSFSWPLDLCKGVWGEDIELHGKQQAHRAHDAVQHETQTQSWYSEGIGCYKKHVKTRQATSICFRLFLPSLPAMPGTCPDSSRECSRRRYARTNYHVSQILPKKGLVFMAHAKRITIHRNSNQVMLLKISACFFFFINPTLHVKDKLSLNVGQVCSGLHSPPVQWSKSISWIFSAVTLWTCSPQNKTKASFWPMLSTAAHKILI